VNYVGRGGFNHGCGRGDHGRGGRSRGGAPRVVLVATVAPGLSAKSAAKSATPPSNAGTG
jgi:hypothetical protein